MSYINVTIDSHMEREDRRQFHMLRAELDFWRKHAAELQDKLENIHTHAEATGSVELWRNGERMTLVLAKPSAETE